MAHGKPIAGNGKIEKNIPADTNYPYTKNVATASTKSNALTGAGKWPYNKGGSK